MYVPRPRRPSQTEGELQSHSRTLFILQKRPVKSSIKRQLTIYPAQICSARDESYILHLLSAEGRLGAWSCSARLSLRATPQCERTSGKRKTRHLARLRATLCKRTKEHVSSAFRVHRLVMGFGHGSEVSRSDKGEDENGAPRTHVLSRASSTRCLTDVPSPVHRIPYRWTDLYTMEAMEFTERHSNA